jgi:gluconokinase
MSEYILGIDIGTTSTKAVLFAASGEMIDQHSVGYPLRSPQAGAQEQDPDEIYQAVVQSVRTVVQRHFNSQSQATKSLMGLSFSAAMHSLIAVDSEGKALTNSITWADRRSAPWAGNIRAQCNAPDLYARTGTPIHPMSPLVKLVWLRHEQPELFQRTAKFISIKEYVIYQWFEQYVVDYSIANATGLFNINNLDWDVEALTLAGVRPDQLSQIVPTTHILTSMKPAAAMAMSLSADIPVVVGSSDGVLANLGVGAIAPDTIAITVGTSGAVRAMLNRPQTDEKERLFCYALSADRWVVGGATNNGGIVLRWVRDHLADAEANTATLLNRDPYDILTEIAATVPAGSDGLIFHPYLAGERSPLWDANARGSFFGLSLSHNKAHLIRAVLEGIVYNLYVISLALQESTGVAQRIQATGGFARSPLWRQMLADVFDRTVTFPESYQGSSFGAAVLGLYALGRIDSLDHVSGMIGKAHHHEPIADNVARYQAILPVYQKLLEGFVPLYGSVSSNISIGADKS